MPRTCTGLLNATIMHVIAAVLCSGAGLIQEAEQNDNGFRDWVFHTGQADQQKAGLEDHHWVSAGREAHVKSEGLSLKTACYPSLPWYVRTQRRVLAAANRGRDDGRPMTTAPAACTFECPLRVA